ncbi:MAG TPA: response regulator [Deltaproteobacteria bacterium]|nr:response regulator [Deltaproteobacteria bacterium]
MSEQDTLLVVDDDPATLDLLTEIFSDEGYKVCTANNGTAALATTESQKPSLVLLDIGMQGMDGFETCVKLKENKKYRDIPLIFVSAMQNPSQKVRGFALGAVDFVSKPFQSDELLARVRTHLELKRLRANLEAAVASRTEELLSSFDRMRKVLGAIIHAMAVAVETRDPYTAGHQRKVSDLARSIGSEMKLDEDVVDGLRMAAAIHDIGKISVPAEILSKPGKLTNLEFSLIQSHPETGYEILKDIDFPWPIARIVLEHHERINGSGYPNGTPGDKLLTESKILAVADVVESMASHRPYRPSLGINAALEEISKNSGILYDGEVVKACLRLFNERGYRLQH